MSVVLGIDTSSTDFSAGIYSGESPVASYSRYIGSSHAEHIAPAIRMMLGINGFEPGTVERIAVAVGPGSFTGLRIGIAFVKGFCFGNTIPVLPVSSLLILANAASHQRGRIIAAIDARNGDVFWAVFSRHEERLERLSDDTVSPAAAFVEAITPGDIVVTDTVGYRKSTVFTSIPAHVPTLPVEGFNLQRGLLCAACGVASINDSSEWREPADIRPNYLRRSAPEERRTAAERGQPL